MTAPARLTLGKEQLWKLKLLAKGQVEWEEMDFEDKKMLYDTGIDLSWKVSSDEMREFERKLALKGEFGVRGIARAAAESASEALIG